MIKWDDYWKKYSISKAERWLILERDKIINIYLDRIDLPKKEIIEIGCGYGSNIKLIKENKKDVEYYALDNSEAAIELTKEEIPNAFCADCRNTPFPNSKFDLVFSAGLMEHFKEEKPFLTEMKRILKHNGYLITFVPGRYSLWKLYQLLHLGMWKHGYEKSYTYNGLRSLFLNNEFDVVEIVGIDPFSISGLIMKLFNITFSPAIRRSFLKSGYTELCIIAKKRFSSTDSVNTSPA
ncbi:MAG: class I SAM-dependent methyltransferase [candidate division Zixibacteria bacterium]|nr:class I SAM-dependent methyltransferase [candidate division Zixibacteria bacterium]